MAVLATQTKPNSGTCFTSWRSPTCVASCSSNDGTVSSVTVVEKTISTYDGRILVWLSAASSAYSARWQAILRKISFASVRLLS